MRRIFLAGAVAGLLALSTGIPAPAAVGTNSTALRNAVTVEGMMEHLEAFQDIADANDDTRASGTPGYDDSADYVFDRLVAAGYSPKRQGFDFDYFEETGPATFQRISPSPTTYTRGDDFGVMEYSGGDDVTGTIVPTNDVQIPPPSTPGSTSGCEASDFPTASTTEDQVALVQRGTCTFETKALNAQNAGYDAVIIFNEGQPGRQGPIGGTLGSASFTIPVIDTTFAVGEELYTMSQSGPVVVRIFTQTITETRHTENIIADTARGRADRVVVVGAHLDSVAEGPGIQDNGSGSAAILEIAEAFSELGITPRNKVRFAWWGAEESGLVGSEYYVSQLSKRQIKNIAVNLNFDMIASPNYVRFVYDGDGKPTGTRGPAGSATVEQVFTKYFSSQGLQTEPTAFDGRSDYGPFIAVGIPAGGLFTGAEGIKTQREERIYGGDAGVAYDPCYHLACDDIDNVNFEALDEMSDAAAHAVLQFAMTTSAPGGTDKASSNAKAKFGTTEFWGSHRVR